MLNDWFQRKLISFSATQNEQVLALFVSSRNQKISAIINLDILKKIVGISWVPFPGAPKLSVIHRASVKAIQEILRKARG